MNDFERELAGRSQRAQEIVLSYLPERGGYADIVIEAMEYSVQNGGKRLRPLLMYAVYELFGGKDEVVYPFMAAIEMIHSYSLVHDDLPAMDNDDLRRGKPTAHKVFGEGMAVLAGDGLLNYAYETAMKAFGMSGKNADSVFLVIEALRILLHYAGIYGIVGGQAVDLSAECGVVAESMTKERLFYIHAHKTAALFRAAMETGAILAGARAPEVETIHEIALDLGMAFQIQDDILDVEGDTKTLGKPAGSDLRNEKVTYVSFYGMDAAKAEVAGRSEKAVESLRKLGKNINGDPSFLIAATGYLTTRSV